jgi:uncharacterized repeat protein (TIGR01451 family)
LEGVVRTRLGVVAFEGDRGAYGDTLTFNGRAVSDLANPANNIFNSSISTNNVPQTTRVPAFPNLLGFDADLFQLDGYLGNGLRSTSLVASTTNDNYYLSTVTLATDLYAPVLSMSKSVTDVNGELVRPGDVLAYTVTVRNTGADAATRTVVIDDIPLNADLVANSQSATNGRVLVAGRRLTAHLGSGHTGTAGGTLAVGESASFSFRVRVQRSAPLTTEIRNVALGSTVGATLGEPIAFTSNTQVSVVGGTSFSVGGATDPSEDQLAQFGTEAGVTAAPRLALTLAERSRRVRPGRIVPFRLRVANTGVGSATSVKACVRIPSGLNVIERGGGTTSGSLLCWTRAVLPAGKELRTRFTVQAQPTARSVRVGVAVAANAANATQRRTSATVAVIGTPARPDAVTG